MSEEYTPTTEVVRFYYCDGQLANVDAHVAFDRWLAKHDAEVRKQSREDVAREIDEVTLLSGLDRRDLTMLRWAKAIAYGIDAKDVDAYENGEQA